MRSSRAVARLPSTGAPAVDRSRAGAPRSACSSGSTGGSHPCRSSPSPAPTARARSRRTAPRYWRPQATGSAPSLRRICATIASASACMTRRSAAMRCCGRSRESRRPAQARRCGPVSLTFFEYNALAALLIFETAQARCLGARSRHGRAPGRGQCRRSDGCRGGEHRPRSPGVSRLDARGHCARKGRYFSPQRAGGVRQPRICRRCSKAPRGRWARRSSALDANTPSHAARAGWSYRGTRWDLPDLPPPALAGETQYRQRGDRHCGRRGARSAAGGAGGRRRAGLDVGAAERALSSGRAGADRPAHRGYWMLRTIPMRLRVLARQFARPADRRQDARRVRHARRQGCRRRCRAAARLHRRVVVGLDRRSARHQRRGAGRADRCADCGPAQSGRATSPPPARRHWRPRDLRTESSCSARSTPSGPAMDWLEARGMLPPDTLREYTDPPRRL